MALNGVNQILAKFTIQINKSQIRFHPKRIKNKEDWGIRDIRREESRRML